MAADLSEQDSKHLLLIIIPINLILVTDILSTKLLLPVKSLPLSLVDLLSTFDSLSLP